MCKCLFGSARGCQRENLHANMREIMRECERERMRECLFGGMLGCERECMHAGMRASMRECLFGS